MRIVIDLQGAQGPSRLRGIGRYSLALAQAIVRNRGQHDIFIALNGLLPDSIASIRAAFLNLLPQDNIRVWSAIGPVNQLDSRNDWRRNSAELIREEFLVSLQPDMVYVTSLFEGLGDECVTSIGKFSSAIPTAVTLYDLIPLINRKPYLDNPDIKFWYESKIENLKKADLLLAISSSSQQEAIDYLEFQPDQTVNVGTAADSQFRRIEIDSDQESHVRLKLGISRPFVMYTGGDDFRKNINGLIRGYAKLPASVRKEHQLAIVCAVRPESRKTLEELSKEVGLDPDEIVLTGYISEEELIVLYHLCRVFVFPSWHEGFGLPALEAMWCGAAVIGANTTSLPEVIGRDDALFDPHDDFAIASKIEQVLTNQEYRSSLIMHGLEQAKKFSWDESGRRAIDAFERFHAANKCIIPVGQTLRQRPKLAYFSPLPPERSGIADYSSELLPELAYFYDIEVVVVQDEIIDRWINENCKVRTVDWFIKHASEYERVLYQIGNSNFHIHMFELLKKFPGTVILHDFYLSGAFQHMDVHGISPNSFSRELYYSHGYPGVLEKFNEQDTGKIVFKYPCNKTILDNAQGVIVHSEYSKQLACSWYGDGFSEAWPVVPLLRSPTITVTRSESRKALSIEQDAFVICCFGILAITKQNQRLLDSWLASELSLDSNCILVFVGLNASGDNGKLENTIQNSGLKNRILITGWTDEKKFNQYLASADMAVQLRTLSRGESSASVLDCMKYGLPTIVNANGSLAELPPDAVYLLPDIFNDSELTTAIETLWRDESRRRQLGIRAREVLIENNSPAQCARQYQVAIEEFYRKAQSGRSKLISTIAKLQDFPNGDADYLGISKAIGENYFSNSKKQLLVDVSQIVQCSKDTKIQKIVGSILFELLANPPEGFRVEPIFATIDRMGYRYARKFTLRFGQCPDFLLDDDVVEVFAGDIFIGLDWQPEVVTVQTMFYKKLRDIGAYVYFVAYDFAPILLPHLFSKETSKTYTKWLEIISESDGVVCSSQSVADDLALCLDVANTQRILPLKLSSVQLTESLNLPSDASEFLAILSTRDTFSTVGSIGSGDSLLQTLKSFEQLWNSKCDVNLVIISTGSDRTESFVQQIFSHPEFNKRLFFKERIAADYIDKILLSSTCLIAANEAGNELPNIKAEQFKLPIIARDIPLFRELTGNSPYFFKNDSKPSVLANAITDWLKINSTVVRKSVINMKCLTWNQSTQNLLSAIVRNNWQTYFMPTKVFRYFGSDSRLGSQVGNRHGINMATSKSQGYLLHGPYRAFPVGRYTIRLKGEIDPLKVSKAYLDVAVKGGTEILLTQLFSAMTFSDQVEELTVNLLSPVPDLEIRVWVDDKAELSISYLEIEPIAEIELKSLANIVLPLTVIEKSKNERAHENKFQEQKTSYATGLSKHKKH